MWVFAQTPVSTQFRKKPQSVGNADFCTYICTIKRTIKLKIMLTATISDFRKDIRRYLDTVTQNFETLIINRGKDSGVVVMSLDEYNSLCATQHELSSKINEKRLDSAIEKLKSGSSFQKDLID